jgi:chloramphenicol-sensitive protein RarD
MFYAITAFVLWGLFPFYFKMLHEVTAFELLVERLLWTCLFLVITLTWRRQWAWVKQIVRQPKVLLVFACSALLISTNWGVYIWAVQQNKIIDASLGYFISPLLSVLMGCIVLRERLRVLQWIAIGCAFVGVAWLTWRTGSVPWIGVCMALTFATYGLLRKVAVLGALEGLALETFVLLPAVLYFTTASIFAGTHAFVNGTWDLKILLMLSGPITAIPLLLFAAGARQMPLSLVGLIQYISPTMQFLIGVWFFNEAFGGDRLIGFGLIWLALIISSAEGMWVLWKKKTNLKPAPNQ